MTEKMTKLEELEYARLASEIQHDRDLQFTVFWQSLAVTALLASILVTKLALQQWNRLPFLLLAPHLVLITASALILNRARAANRKSGYVVVAFNADGQGRAGKFRNWEHDLCVLRKRSEQGREPHRTTTTLHMLLTTTSVEVICIVAFLFAIVARDDGDSISRGMVEMVAAWGYLMFYAYTVTRRVRAYFCMRYADSIQGFAAEWRYGLDLPHEVVQSFGCWDPSTWKCSLLEEMSGKYGYFWTLFLKAAAPKGSPDVTGQAFEVKNREWHVAIGVTILFLGTVLIVYDLTHQERSGRSLPVIVGVVALACAVYAWDGRRQRRRARRQFKHDACDGSPPGG